MDNKNGGFWKMKNTKSNHVHVKNFDKDYVRSALNLGFGLAAIGIGLSAYRAAVNN